MDQGGGEGEADAGFEAGQGFGEGGDGGGMRMANGDGGAVAGGVTRGEVELAKNRRASFDVIEENFARCGAHAGALGGIESDSGGGGAAVDEKEIAATQRVHQFGHELRIGGSERAFVIVDADGVRNVGEHLAEQPIDFIGGHSEAQFNGLGFGGAAFELHGKVKHDLIAAPIDFVGDFGGVQLIGQDGKSKRKRQFEERRGGGLVAAHVVNDDGKARSGIAAGGNEGIRRGEGDANGMGALAIQQVIETNDAGRGGLRKALQVMASGGTVESMLERVAIGCVGQVDGNIVGGELRAAVG